MKYRGFTILESGDDYEILHPKEGTLQKCGMSPSIEGAKKAIDMRLRSLDLVMD